MAWRLARALETLRAEVEERWPGTVIWALGDAAHAARASDHNPGDDPATPGNDVVVTAIDIVSDHASVVWDHLLATKDDRVEYIIHKGHKSGTEWGWGVSAYTGPNPHDGHIHVSVGRGTDGHPTRADLYDDPAPWGISDAKPAPKPKPKPKPTDWTTEVIMSLPTLRKGDEGPDVRRLQGLCHAAGQVRSAIDGDFGSKTERDVKAFQKANRTKNSITASGAGDGVAGRYTWTDLLGQ